MSAKRTQDGKEARAGDKLYLAHFRHENPLNVGFWPTTGEVVEAHGELVVVSHKYGIWGATEHVGNWFSTLDAAKLHALAQAEETFAKFRAAVVAATPQ